MTSLSYGSVHQLYVAFNLMRPTIFDVTHRAIFMIIEIQIQM